LTAHLSNFPLVSVALTLLGIPNYFVMKQIKVKMTDEYFNGLEDRLGVKIIDLFPRDQCTRDCLRALQENKVIVLALDLDAHREGIFVEFFGNPASTYVGPLVLARRTGAVLLPGFLAGQADHSYRLVIHPPLSPPRSKRDYPRVLQEYNRLLEDCIRRYPEQYNWIYKRWKTRPPGREEEKIYRKGY
jgi:KDO2-lipid IV(A) lauroyltransferase